MAEVANAPMVLTPEELQRITKRTRPSAQARVLDHLGIPHLRHPIDGSVVAGRAAALRALAAATDLPGKDREEASNGLNWSKKA
ncbi:DUF4224 domain-containing protein [Variovorax paradoxus]|uniref:DUF4224 domain-containing protein n=1 Tax=Variovorax paradoxus TaxID=34073 RepID=UPI0029C6749D|nr:DUF4224 domain-containing protein [Variovorax paradoxus]WPH22271.1 DUF4224 domain-containing protein [Variovorax paradoxus]